MLSKKDFKEKNVKTLKSDYTKYVTTMTENRRKSITFEAFISNQYKSYTIERELESVESSNESDDDEY